MNLRKRLAVLEAGTAEDWTMHVAEFLLGGNLLDGISGLHVLNLAETVVRHGWKPGEQVRQAITNAVRASYTGAPDRVADESVAVLQRIESLRAGVEERAAVLGADLRFL